MKFLKNKWTIIGVLVAAIGLLTAFSYESKKTPQYFTEKVQKGDIQNVVQATGTIKSTVAEAKTVDITTPSGFTGVTNTVTFVAGAAVAANSTISASPSSGVTAVCVTSSHVFWSGEV